MLRRGSAVEIFVCFLAIVPARELIGIVNAEGLCIRLSPVGQLGRAGRRRASVQEVRHETFYLVHCDHHVALHLSDDMTHGEPDRRRHWNDRTGLAYDIAYSGNEIAESKGFGADGVHYLVEGSLPLFHSQRGKIPYVHRLQAVPAVAKYAEDGKGAQDPGDVVHEDVFFPE